MKNVHGLAGCKSNNINLRSEKNLEEALKIINQPGFNVDCILIDGTDTSLTFLKAIDGYKNKKLIAKTIVIDEMKLKMYNLNNYDYQIYTVVSPEIIKTDLPYLVKNVKQIPEFDDKKIKDEISEILKKLGLPPNRLGFAYFHRAIYVCLLRNGEKISITNDIYPMLAREFHRSVASVEKTMRDLLTTNFSFNNYDITERLFGNSLGYDRVKPTNSELIFAVVEELSRRR